MEVTCHSNGIDQLQSDNDNADANSNNIVFTIKDANFSTNLSLKSLYQQKITRDFQNFLVTDLIDQYIRLDTKQKVE